MAPKAAVTKPASKRVGQRSAQPRGKRCARVAPVLVEEVTPARRVPPRRRAQAGDPEAERREILKGHFARLELVWSFMKIRKTVSNSFGVLKEEIVRGTSQSLTLEMVAQMANAAPGLLRVEADPASTAHQRMLLVVQVDSDGKALTHTKLSEAAREERCDKFNKLLDEAWPVPQTHPIVFPPPRRLHPYESDPDRLSTRLLAVESPVKKRRVEVAEKPQPAAAGSGVGMLGSEEKPLQPAADQSGAAPKSVYDLLRERVRARQAAKAKTQQLAWPAMQADEKKMQVRMLTAMHAFATATLNVPLRQAKNPLQTTVRTMCEFLQERAQFGLTLEALEKNMRDLAKVVDAKGRPWIEIVPPRSHEVTCDLVRLSNVAEFRDVLIAVQKEASAA